ncbi:MAG TPA: IS4 family transposase [Gaiellaceae bacterium]
MSSFVKNPLQVAATIEKIFGDDLHAMRVLSLANSVVGTVDAAVLSIHAIGRGYAHVANKREKHGVKQTDRMLGNAGIDVWQLFRPWAQFVVGERKEIVLALDWTEFDTDDHATLAGYLITSHGRATPLIWMTVSKTTLKNKRNDHEYRLIERLHECLAADVKITLLADRGFGDQKLYRFLQTLGWDFVIRFRGVIQVEDAAGTRKTAKAWVPESGRATMMRSARVTRTRAEVPAVVVVHAKGMDEAWCLATSLGERTASEIVKLYGRRFTIEETFRDQKNFRFGLGMSATHIGSTDRRDRLLLLAAIAQALLTLLGAAGEACGLDRLMKSNTSKKRTMSLLNQGINLYAAIPNMGEDRLGPLMKAFDDGVRQHAIFRAVFGLI